VEPHSVPERWFDIVCPKSECRLASSTCATSSLRYIGRTRMPSLSIGRNCSRHLDVHTAVVRVVQEFTGVPFAHYFPHCTICCGQERESFPTQRSMGPLSCFKGSIRSDVGYSSLMRRFQESLCQASDMELNILQLERGTKEGRRMMEKTVHRVEEAASNVRPMSSMKRWPWLHMG